MLTIPEKIKELLHTDSVKKNIRIHFPNGERQDICNDLIVMDSVKFTESLCSQDTLKFGLCESPIFECETVGVGNIVGLTIEVYSEIFCDLSVEGSVFRTDIQETVYPIPLGAFVVEKCDRQSDIIHRKITAYSQIAHSFETLKNPVNIAKIESGKFPNSNMNLNQNAIALICSEIPNTAHKMFEKNQITDYTGTAFGEIGRFDIEPLYPPGAEPFRIVLRSQCHVIGKVINDADKYLISYEENGYAKSHIDEIITNLVNQIQEKARYWSHPVSYDELKRKVTECLYNGIDIASRLSVRTSSSNWGTYYQAGVTDRQGVIYPYVNGENYPQLAVSFETVFAIDAFAANRAAQMGEFNFEDYEAKIYEFDTSGINNAQISIAKNLAKTPSNDYVYTEKVDIRAQYDAFAELSGEFGRIDRDATFSLVNIKQQFGLTPSEELYPSETLYPEGPVGEAITMSDYQTCEYPENYMIPFGLVMCTYKDTSNEPATYFLYLDGFDETSDISSYRVYDITNNEIIKNSTWTQSQIEAFCNTIADNIDGVTYVPMQLVGRGLPYVETGDTVSVQTKANDSITTILLNRTMQGEIALTDTFTSK